ncbi:MAG: hypothetical protein KJO55_05015 [Gammaproteobacteria bacterium]|nr:hypothetical protein [Gammaproteobacteria bacterium]
MSQRAVVLVPGLFSPRWLLWPLKRSLNRAGFAAHTWDEARIFAPAEQSVELLRQHLLAGADRSIDVVTHSFGDWLFRQAMAEPCPAVRRVVALAPVMRSSPVAAAANALGLGRLIPEVAVMASENRAGERPGLPTATRRLVVWARFDPWIRRPALDDSQTVVTGTHNSIVLMPAVHRLVRDYLGDDAAG